MKAKEFGIYADNYTVLIFTDVNDYCASGVFWPSKIFHELSNKHINDWLKIEYLTINKREVFNISPGSASEIISNAGYLGQVDEKLHDELFKLIRKLV